MPAGIKVLRDKDGDGKPDETSVFAEGLHEPFGIAFYPTGKKPEFVYIGMHTDSVARFPYREGDMKARSMPETIVPATSGGGPRGRKRRAQRRRSWRKIWASTRRR